MDWTACATAVAAVAVLMLFVTRFRGGAAGRRVLLDVGHPRVGHQGIAATLVPIAIAMLLLTLKMLARDGVRSTVSVLVTMALSLGVVYAWRSRAHLRFTEGGIAFMGLTKWSEIRSLRWLAPTGDGDRLQVGSFLLGRGTTTVYTIAPEYRDRVDAILASHAPPRAHSHRAGPAG